MQKQITDYGLEFVLLDPEYLSVIKENNPDWVFDAKLSIANCGKIICFSEMNEYFDCFEPITNEYDLDAIYQMIR